MTVDTSSKRKASIAEVGSIALVVSVSVAFAETSVIAALYADLPFSRGPFLAFYLAGYSVAAGLLTSVVALALARLFGAGPARVAVGLSAGWAIVLLGRGYGCLVHFESFAREDWTRVTAVFVAALVAACAIGIAVRLALSLVDRSLPYVGMAYTALAVTALVLRLLVSPDAEPPPDFRPLTATPTSDPLLDLETNLLLIVIDTLRADHTTPYGYLRDTSPHMQALSERGITFERCVTQRTNTTPAMATLMTGLYPPTVGVVDAGDFLADSHQTLGELLTEHGYDTAAFCANGMAGPRYNLDQGIDHFRLFSIDEQLESRTVNAAVVPWLEQERTGPFFLWVHYKDPHWPYEVPESHAELYTDTEQPTELESRISQYDAEIRYVDESIGEIFDTLDRLDLWDETLVILTADHGESLGEHDYYYSHGAYCYEPTAHIPLILHHPELRQPMRVGHTVGLVDLVPTLAELMGFQAGSDVQGRSFARTLAGDDFDRGRYSFVLGGGPVGYHSHAITSAEHKLVFDVDGRWVYLDVGVELAARLWEGAWPDHPYRFRVVRRELYDLRSDPREENNLAGLDPELESELDTRLWDWIHEVYRGWERPDPTMPRDVLEELRSLGYL